MIKRANPLSAQMVYDDTGRDDFTTAVVAAIDNQILNPAIYPYAYKATVNEDFDTHQWFAARGSCSMTTEMKFAFGVFLAADNDPNVNRIFTCSGTATFLTEGNQFFRAYAIFGKTDGATITIAHNAPENLLGAYIILPLQVAHPNNAYSYTISYNTEVTAISDTANYNFFSGIVVENAIGAGQNISMNATTSMVSNKTGIAIPSPIGIG